MHVEPPLGNLSQSHKMPAFKQPLPRMHRRTLLKTSSASPAPGSGTRASTPAAGSVVLLNAYVASVKRIAELCVIKLSDSSVQVLCGLKLHNANSTSSVSHHIGVGRLDHLPEVVLQCNVFIDKGLKIPQASLAWKSMQVRPGGLKRKR